jgi:hypothetical protein
MRSISISLSLASFVAPERVGLWLGFNLFSANQDVEIGRQVSQDAEPKLKLIHSSPIRFLHAAVGQQIAANAPGQHYPDQFKVVNDAGINALALPGGVLYINRGIFDNATHEAQLTRVVARGEETEEQFGRISKDQTHFEIYINQPAK